MRNIFSTFILLFFFFNSSAQYYSMDESKQERDSRMQTQRVNSQKFKEQKIKEIKKFKFDKKTNQSILAGIYNYDVEGNMLLMKGFKKGVAVYSYENSYDANNNNTNSVHYRKGKLDGKDVYEYDSEGNETMRASFGKGGRPGVKIVSAYDKDKNCIAMSRYKSNGKLFYRYEYDFYTDGSRREARWYDSKGKLGSVFTYDCGAVGKTAKEMSKDTALYCVKYDVDAEGNKVKIVELDMKKRHGWISKTTTDKNGNEISFVSIDPKGKIQWKSTSKFDANNYRTESVFYKKGGADVRSRSEYQYDVAGNNVKTIIHFGTKKEEVYTSEYVKF